MLTRVRAGGSADKRHQLTKPRFAFEERAKALTSASPRGPCPWQDGRTPLHLAARNDHSAVAEVLLAAKAKVDATDKVGP